MKTMVFLLCRCVALNGVSFSAVASVAVRFRPVEVGVVAAGLFNDHGERPCLDRNGVLPSFVYSLTD
jgi:hypothetical protein